MGKPEYDASGVHVRGGWLDDIRAEAEVMQPVATGERYAVVFHSDDDESVGAFVGSLARDSVEFTFDPLPDGYYEVTTKVDQRGHVERLLRPFREED